MKSLALIPARGGSKGILGKNLKLLGDKPLLAYAIDAAAKSGSFDEIIVSTDSEEIAKVAKQYGAKVPFLRPSQFATDTSSDFEVIKHALDWYKEHNQEFDYVAYLRPTAPFRPSNGIKEALALLEKKTSADSVRSVTKAEGVHHPYWMYKQQDQFLTEFVDGIKIKDYYQRQLLPDCYRLNGVIDIFRASNITKFKNLYGENILPYVLENKYSVDIDTADDLKYAEYILKSEQV